MSKSKIKPIRTEADYQAALARIDALMDAAPGSLEGEELDVLADLVEPYEAKHVRMGYPSPVAAIEFRIGPGRTNAKRSRLFYWKPGQGIGSPFGKKAVNDADGASAP